MERALERIEPSPTAFGDTMRRTRRRQRNRRASAGALGLFLTAAVVLGLWASMTEGRPEPATRTPTSAPIAMGDRLFLAGDGEAWVVDIERSAVHHLVLPELAPGDPDTRVVRRGDVLVAWGMSGPVILDPSNNFASRPLVEGDGRLFLPSARDERVWIEIVNEGSPDEGEGSRSIREVELDGSATTPDALLPDGPWPVASAGPFLLFQDLDGFGLFPWNPDTGEFAEELRAQYPLAGTGNILAWCANDCQWLHVTNVASGDEQFDLACPAGAFGFDGDIGAFSPDGRTLALSIRLDFGQDSPRALALLDMRTRELDIVDGTNVEAGYVFVDWSPSGDAAYIAGGQANRQLIRYDLAEDEAKAIRVDVGPFYGMAAV